MFLGIKDLTFDVYVFSAYRKGLSLTAGYQVGEAIQLKDRDGSLIFDYGYNRPGQSSPADVDRFFRISKELYRLQDVLQQVAVEILQKNKQKEEANVSNNQ